MHDFPSVGDVGADTVDDADEFVFEAGYRVDVAEDLGETGLVDFGWGFPFGGKVYGETEKAAEVCCERGSGGVYVLALLYG
jgi:hypothetical protein